MFRLAPETNTVGTTQMGEVEVPPALMVRRFGPPSEFDRFKVSGQYVFADAAGQPFVVHDWKATSLWNESFPSPAEFWAMEVPQEISISTRDLDTGAFERWFLDQLGVE